MCNDGRFGMVFETLIGMIIETSIGMIFDWWFGMRIASKIVGIIMGNMLDYSDNCGIIYIRKAVIKYGRNGSKKQE